MRRFFVSIIGALAVFSAVATGENLPTSKSYVDSALTQKQDTIERTTGANQALTNTGTAGEYGTKGIYDSTGEYTTQQNALVDAQTMNTGVQNAIDSEFQCIKWVDDDPTKDCLLMEIRGTTGHSSSKNLFDISNAKVFYKNPSRLITSKSSNSITVTYPNVISSSAAAFALVELGDINDFLGKTLVISATANCIDSGRSIVSLTMCDDNGSNRTNRGSVLTVPMEPDPTLTKIAFRLYAVAGGIIGTNPSCTYSNIQVEEGTTATSYEPYSNPYLPVGN